MDNFNLGYVFLIKDGQKSKKMITVSTNEMKNIEMKLKSPDLFFREIQDGYSVIMIHNWIINSKQIMNKYSIALFLSPNLSQFDADLIQNILKEKDSNCSNYYIFNYDNNGDYDYTTSADQAQKLHIVADYFIHEKLNQLDEEEKEMFEKYRTFNLNEILLEDFEVEYPINHRNAGVIFISKSTIFCRSLRRKSHLRDIDFILQQLYPSQDFSEYSMLGIVRITNDILIFLNQGEVLIWLPEQINEYQKKQLQLLVQELEKITVVTLNVYFSIVLNSKDLEDNKNVKDFHSLNILSKYLEFGPDYLSNFSLNRR